MEKEFEEIFELTNEDKERVAKAKVIRSARALINRILREKDIKKKDLAEMMEVSPGRVSQILKLDKSIQLDTLAGILFKLDAELTLNFRDTSKASMSDGYHIRTFRSDQFDETCAIEQIVSVKVEGKAA